MHITPEHLILATLILFGIMAMTTWSANQSR